MYRQTDRRIPITPVALVRLKNPSPIVRNSDAATVGSLVATKTRSSAQGNCSAKSLAASAMSSILPCPPYLPLVMLSEGGGSSGGGGSNRGEGAGDISSNLPCTTLPRGASPQRDFAQSGLMRKICQTCACVCVCYECLTSFWLVVFQ